MKFSGSIVESINFENLIGPPPPEMVVDCEEVIRLNSHGVREWIKYFQKIEKKKIKLKFVKCSTVVVDQINLISNFTCGGTVESIFVPFSCTQCKADRTELLKTEDLKKLALPTELPKAKCAKCGGEAVFIDDIPEEYFAFVNRTPIS